MKVFTSDFNWSNAVFKSVYTTSEQTLARMKTLLLTRKGERYQLPTYGTNLLDILFQPNICY